MSNTYQFVKAVKRQEKLRLALDGTAGSGKTWTALIIATYLATAEDPAHKACRPGSSEPCGHIAVIDSERSSARKYASDFAFDHLTLPDFNPHTYIGAVRSAVGAGYPVIDIDSFSHAWEGVLQFKDDATARSKSKNSYTEGWREATPVHNELVDTVLRANAHIIATLRTKTEYVIDDGKPTKVGMKPIQRDGVDFEFDIVGDMTPENTLIVSKTRCSAIAGQVIRKPDERFAETLWEWLNDGEEMLGAAEIEAIKEALNTAGQAARRGWLDRFGMKPDDLPAARRDEATEFINNLGDWAEMPEDTNSTGAGDDVPDRGGDAGETGDGGNGQDVARTEPEPAPPAQGERAAAAPVAAAPEPDQPIDARRLGIRAPKVFEQVIESYPERRKTWLNDSLRHSLAYIVSNGEATSANDLDPEQLLTVWRLLDAVEARTVTFTWSALPTKGVEWTWADGTTSTVLWTELTLADAGAA